MDALIPLLVGSNRIEDLGNVFEGDTVHGKTQITLMVIGQIVLIIKTKFLVELSTIQLGDTHQIPITKACPKGIVRHFEFSENPSRVVHNKHVRVYKVDILILQGFDHCGDHLRVTDVIRRNIGAKLT